MTGTGKTRDHHLTPRGGAHRTSMIRKVPRIVAGCWWAGKLSKMTRLLKKKDVEQQRRKEEITRQRIRERCQAHTRESSNVKTERRCATRWPRL